MSIQLYFLKWFWGLLLVILSSVYLTHILSSNVGFWWGLLIMFIFGGISGGLLLPKYSEIK